MNYGEKVRSMGLVLPPCPSAVGSYNPLIIDEGIAYLSGQIAKKADGDIIRGCVGGNLELAEGQEAARIAALNVISVIQNLLGFGKLDRFLRVVGYVHTAPDFYEIPQVLNAASDLFKEVFLDRGVHARSAIGVSSLPLNSAVELEVTLRIK